MNKQIALIKNIVIASLLLLFSLDGLSQGIKVSGQVKDVTNGETLPGATVQIKGTSIGTITDFDGLFSLSAEPENTLVITFVGFHPMEILVGNQVEINVNLKPDIEALEEVVVVGYTSKKKKDIVGSVAVVDMEEVGKIVYANPLQALQGRVAGVNFTQTGAPGSTGTDINIRGFSTFSGKSTPLFVIDGVPSEEPPNNISGNDIASIQVLKDASAAIYGSRAANGVIIITTKNGRNKLNVDAGAIFSTQTRANYLDLLNAKEWGEVYWDAFANSRTGTPSFTGYFDAGGKPSIPVDAQLYTPDVDDASKNQSYLYTEKGTNWADEIYRNSFSQQYYANISNGNDKGNVMFGASYFNEQGTITTSYFERFTIRLNSNFKPTSWMDLGENLNLAKSQRLGIGGEANDVVRQHPALPVYDTDGDYAGRVGAFPDIRNSVSQLDRNRNNTSDSWRILGNLHGEVRILDALNVLPDEHSFNIRTNLGLEYSNFYDNNFSSRLFEGVYQVDDNSYRNTFGQGVTTTFQNFAEYGFDNGAHSLKLIGGLESIEYQFRDLSAAKSGYTFEIPSYITINSGSQITDAAGKREGWGLYSEVARLDYVYKSKYLLTALYRHDQTSRFSPDGDFVTLMGGWRFTEEAFVKNLIGDKIVNDGKLRVSYGELGNQGSSGYYNQSTFFGPNQLTANYDLSGTNNSVDQGFVVTSRGNPLLKWETTKSFNVGADLKLFNNTIDLTFDVYKKVTTDLISNPPLNQALGEGTAPFINSAKLDNTGFDLNITHFYSGMSNDLSIATTVQVSHYKNKVVDLDDRYPLGNEGERYFGGFSRVAEGQAAFSFYGWEYDGLFRNEEEVVAHATQTGKGIGRMRFKDLNEDGVINDQDRTYIGSFHPDITLGLNSSIKYKKFYLDMFFYSSLGADVYNDLRITGELAQIGNYNRTSAILDAFDETTNPSGKVPKLTLDDQGNDESRASSYFLENGNFVKMRTLRFGYNLMPDFLDGGKLNVYTEIQNVFTITNYSGIDPEVPRGFDGGVYPLPRTFILGFNLKF